MFPYIVDNFVKVSALVVDIEVKLNACLSVFRDLGENWRDISVAHKTQAKCLDTVVYVHPPRYRLGQIPWI